MRKIFLIISRKKNPRRLSEEKFLSFEFKQSPRNHFADAPAANRRNEAFPAVVVSARRNDRHADYRLDEQLNLKVRQPPQEIFQPLQIFFPIVNDNAQAPADNRAQKPCPTARTVAPYAERNKHQPDKLRSSEPLKKFFHVDTSSQAAPNLFAAFINAQQSHHGHADNKAAEQVKPTVDSAETENQNRHQNQINYAPHNEKLFHGYQPPKNIFVCCFINYNKENSVRRQKF